MSAPASLEPLAWDSPRLPRVSLGEPRAPHEWPGFGRPFLPNGPAYLSQAVLGELVGGYWGIVVKTQAGEWRVEQTGERANVRRWFPLRLERFDPFRRN